MLTDNSADKRPSPREAGPAGITLHTTHLQQPPPLPQQPPAQHPHESPHEQVSHEQHVHAAAVPQPDVAQTA